MAARARVAILCLVWAANAAAGGQSDTRAIEAAPSSPQAAANLLGDEDLSLAGEATRVHGQMGSAAFPTIRETLASGSARQCRGATVALHRSSADVGPFLPVLTRQLSQQDDRLVLASLGALMRLHSRAVAALPELRASSSGSGTCSATPPAGTNRSRGR